MKLAVASIAGAGALVLPAAAQELAVTVEIPRLEVAEYHAPYLAMWLEDTDGAATSLAVWYDVDLKNEEGETWLKDLRQWWRRAGRSTDMPVDGVSGPTRPPGAHDAEFSLSALAPGEYAFVIEAAREVGGRELLRTPIALPADAQSVFKLQGEHELGLVTVTVKP